MKAHEIPTEVLERMERFYSHSPTGQYDDEVLALIQLVLKNRRDFAAS